MGASGLQGFVGQLPAAIEKKEKAEEVLLQW